MNEFSAKITLKLESCYKIPTLLIYNLAQEHNLTQKSSSSLDGPSSLVLPCTHFKRKNKISLTVLSGPHVHKKSREQFAISSYVSLYHISIQHSLDLANFSQFKQHLLNLSVSNGFQVSFSYNVREILFV